MYFIIYIYTVKYSNGNGKGQTVYPRCLLVQHPMTKYVCVEILRPSQTSGVMSSAVSLPSHTFTGQT